MTYFCCFLAQVFSLTEASESRHILEAFPTGCCFGTTGRHCWEFRHVVSGLQEIPKSKLSMSLRNAICDNATNNFAFALTLLDLSSRWGGNHSLHRRTMPAWRVASRLDWRHDKTFFPHSDILFFLQNIYRCGQNMSRVQKTCLGQPRMCCIVLGGGGCGWTAACQHWCN